MILFTIKKTFFDMWDNLFRIILLNLVLLILIAICIYLPAILLFNPLLSILAAVFTVSLLFVAAGAGFLFALEIAKNSGPGFFEYIEILKKSWKTSLGFFVLFAVFLLVARFSITYYYSKATIGSAGYVYKGEPGTYNIKVKYLDKAVYTSSFTLFVNNEKKHSWKGDILKSSDNFIIENAKNISLKDNDVITVKGKFDGRDLAVIDSIIIENSSDPDKSIKIEAEDMILDNYKPYDFKDASNNKIITLTLTFKGIIWLASATFLSMVSIIIILSMQFFFPVYGLLNKSFYKTIKTCFIIFFDNTFFSVIMFAGIVIILVLSFFFVYILPGIITVFLWLSAGIKLRLYKYDYMEQNKDADRRNIPWEELIAGDRDTLGRRTLKGLIFPWKD